MKRNLRKAFAFILALTMVVSLFACGKKDANPDGGDSSSDDTFTIAYIGPLTGEASAWGTPEANTLKLLVDQVNAEGGIAGKKVILNTYDNRGDNVETTNAAKKAIEVGGADVIVGCNSSGASLALASVCEEYKVPSVATCATNSKVTEDDNGNVREWTFRVCLADPALGNVMAKYEDIRDNCIGYINIDSTGMRGAEKYGTDASRELSDYAYEMIRDVLDEDVDVAYLAKTGDQSFFGVGVPSIAGRISYSPEVVKQQNGATLGYWNHTCEDSIDKMDVDNLEKDNRVDLGVIYGLANATVLPYDFSKTCEDMKQKVEYLRKESGNIVDMECISANIDRLGKAVAALNEMKLKASELSEVRIRAFNDTLLRLSRAITNAFYTNAEKYDQDSYGRTILSKPLPLLFPTIKLSRLDKDTLEYRLLYTQMLRNRNRVADAVLTACEYAELFLAQK